MSKRSTAIHEAGHAVIGRVLGLACGGATIIANPADLREAGSAIIDGQWGTYGLWDRRGRYRDIRTVVLGGILALMAGAEAERLIVGRVGVGDGDDRRQIAMRMDSADYAGGCASEPRLRRATRALVQRHRSAIEALAAVLIKKGTLSGDEVDAVVGLSAAPVLRAADIIW